MARVVESVLPDYGDAVRYEKVETKKMTGALRYGELSKRLGRPVPVPSIFVNDELVFETTPSGEVLREWLDHCLASNAHDD